jgi:hypothetical protein
MVRGKNPDVMGETLSNRVEAAAHQADPSPLAAPSLSGSRRPGWSSGERSVFLILLALYFLVLYPILRADRYYNDDLKRALIGRTGWDSNGRPLTTLLMKLLQCYDSALVDISPLTQIGAIALLAWAGVLIARRYAIGSPWMAALVVFPLGAQPFYLENLSYKFDALSMSLALLLALLPIVAPASGRRGWWLGVLALFASLNFYQPAINACLIFILLEVVIAQLRGIPPRQLATQCLMRVLQLGTAMLAYQLIVGIHINGWVKRESEKVHGLHDLPQIKTNLIDFYAFIGDSFNRQWWNYFAPVLLLLALFPIAVGIRYALKARRTQPLRVRAALLATSFLLPLAALVCVLGPMLLLLRPEIEPRVLMGVGALLTAALIVMQAALRQWRRSDRWTLAVAGMLALGMGSFASAYGNAQGEQKSYEDRIATRLADDLAELKASHSIHAFLLDGSAGYAPVTAHVIGQLPLVRSLIAPYLSAATLFPTHMFLMHYIQDMIDMRAATDARSLALTSTILARTCQAPVIRSTSAYSLRLIDDVAVVTFRADHPPRCNTTAPPGQQPPAGT